jgi:ABC-type Zn uptake system ZnuABC Zn-binding protein ZnuA
MNNLRLYLILLFLTILCPFSGKLQKISIVTSTSIFADMITNVGKSHVSVVSIVPVGIDPHGYEPTSGDIRSLSGADLIMINGLDLEIWINKVIRNIKFPNDRVIVISKGIQPLTSKDFKNSKDPHAWLSAKNGLIYIENIYKAIDKVIPAEEKKSLEHNYEQYKKKLLATKNFMHETINTIPSVNRKLVTAHDAFQYFGKEYGMNLYPLQGISPESDILIKDFQNTISLIKKYKIPAIFVENTINPKTLQNLANEAGCVIGGKLYADSLGDSLGAAPDYLSMLRSNVKTIANGLTRVQSDDKNVESKVSENTTVLYLLLISLMGLSFFFMIKSLK